MVESLPHRPISSWRIHPGRGPTFRGGYPADHTGIAIDRALFDGALASWATGQGAELREDEQVVDLLRGSGGVSGVTTRNGREHRGRLVIGCDGLRSVVMRRAGLLKRSPVLRKAALTAHVRGARLRERGCGELHLLPWGTAGIVEIGDGVANVVLVMDRPARRPNETVPMLFDRLIVEVPALRRATRAGEVRATGPFDVPTRGVVTHGVMLVGDAAGYFDPFTGQGIYRALRGARLAADAAETALHHPDREHDALRVYARAHRIAFSPGVALQKLIEGATSHETLLSLLAGGLARFPSSANLIVRRTGDIPPRWPRRAVGRVPTS